MKDILIIFGGQSAEHEVSVITGLQVFKEIDLERYNPHLLYITKNGEFQYISKDSYKVQILNASGRHAYFDNSGESGVLKIDGFIKSSTVKIDAAYLALHGGSGEDGRLQSLLSIYSIPYTSPSYESSMLTMNKAISKEVLEANNVPVLDSISFLSQEIDGDLDSCVAKVINQFSEDVVIKPAHFGSSIGIVFTKSKADIKRGLLEASNLDTEVLVEPMVKDFTEYNISVKSFKGEIVTSPIEEPVSTEEYLSFKDKYEGGSKKTGSAGMSSLKRKLPAEISEELVKEIEKHARRTYKAVRCDSLVRIDFMYSEKYGLTLTEINSIPGSMSFYLWEADGIEFTKQITELIEESIRHKDESRKPDLEYETNILEDFLKQD